MKTILTNNLLAACMLLVGFGAQAQNILLDRKYWESNPSMQDVQQKINEGNDPSEFNAWSFDPVVYAILENADLEIIDLLIHKEGNSINKITHDGRTYLFWAAYKGNLPLVKYLLDEGASLDIVDDHGFTVMNFAANSGQTGKELYDMLITAGADVKKEKDLNGANVLLLMTPFLQDMGMVNYFEGKGLSVKDLDAKGNSAFNYAARTGNIEMMDLLIDQGVDYKTLNTEGGNAMLFAAKGSRGVINPLSVYKYLEKKGVEPNIITKSGITPLHILAAENTDVATFKYFMKKGVDANRQNADGLNALMIAAYENDLAVVEFLVNETKEINTTNAKGETSLNRAVAGNTAEVVNFLLSEGAHVNEATGEALIASYRKGKEKELEARLASIYADNFNPSAVQAEGNTLLHYAVQRDDLGLVKIVLNWEMEINAVNDDGNTALHLAAMKTSNPEMLQYLIDQGADANAKTVFGESAFDLASENELLAKNGANLSFLKS